MRLSGNCPTHSQSLDVSQTSSDNLPIIQEIAGFSENEIAYYAGKTLTLSDGNSSTNDLEISFNISGTTETLAEVITKIFPLASFWTK